MELTYTFSFLTAQDMQELHQVFLKSFEDYVIPIQLTTEQFNTKLKRESISPAFCVAAYADQEMVGFILTGLGEYNGKPSAYNAGTGVLPKHRGHNLTASMYAFLVPKLRESGIEQGLLEVIQENEPALKVYKSSGFKVTRSLDCFRALRGELLLADETPEDITITASAKPNWELYKHFWDVQPTWQNTPAAIAKSPDDKVYLEAKDEAGEVVGYIILFTKTGAVAQLAVQRERRELGIGKALLREALTYTTAPALLIINVDAAAVAFKAFLQRRHFNRFLGQFEMVLPLA